MTPARSPFSPGALLPHLVTVVATQVGCGVFVEALGHAVRVLLLDPFDEFGEVDDFVFDEFPVGEVGHVVESLLDFLGSFCGFPSAQVFTGFALGFRTFGDQHGGGDGRVGDS